MRSIPFPPSRWTQIAEGHGEDRGGDRLALGLLRVAALAFWFFLAFPFGHHNESYFWQVLLERSSLLDALTTRFGPVVTLRPLGQATAWLLFHASGGGIVLGQIFNFAVTVAAWSVLGGAFKMSRAFVLVAALVQGALFGGYIYLFHVHGVFYGPLILLIATLIRSADAPFDERLVVRTGLFALVVSLYHPFSASAYVAFLAGRFVEARRATSERTLAFAGVAAAVLLGLAYAVARVPGDVTPERSLRGLLACYRATEPHLAVSVVAAALCLLAILDLGATAKARAAIMIAVGVAVAACVAFQIPVVILWLVLSAVRAAALGRASLVFMVLALGLLPLPVGTGSATHAIPALFAGAAATALGQTSIEDRLRRLRPTDVAAVIVPAAALLCAVLRLRAGVPVLSSLASPLLSEKERSQQLESILAWTLSSPYAGCRVRLDQAGLSPIEMPDVLERRTRAPAAQGVIDFYLDARRPRSCPAKEEPVAVFGGATLRGGELLFTAPSLHAGAASLFLPGASARDRRR